MTLLNSKIYDCLAACINLFFFLLYAHESLSRSRVIFREKGKSPEMSDTRQLPPALFVFIRIVGSLFRSIVLNCSVRSKANSFVFKQSYDSSVILLVTVVNRR